MYCESKAGWHGKMRGKGMARDKSIENSRILVFSNFAGALFGLDAHESRIYFGLPARETARLG